MFASMMSRKLVAILLVGVGGLLVVTLYKMQVLSDFVLHQGNGGQGFKVSPAVNTATTTTSAPLLHRKEEQVEMGNVLFKMLIKDPVEYTCKNIIRIKNVVEGEWKFCGDRDFELKKPCLVYSFGIAYDFTFDDILGKRGCDVFSFDPSMNTSDHRRNEHVVFSQTGLGGEDTDTFVPSLSSYVKQKTTWKMRTLQTLMKERGHSNRVIDLLKIDIETSEWPVVRHLLGSGVMNQVKQFLVEWHIFPGDPAGEEFLRLVKVLKDLRRAGFVSYDKHPHPFTLDWKSFNLQSDFGYINMRFVNSSRQ